MSKESLKIRIRLMQMFFIGLFCLGLSWALTDLTEFFKLPISSISVGMMSFGALGAFFIEIVLRRFETFF